MFVFPFVYVDRCKFLRTGYVRAAGRIVDIAAAEGSSDIRIIKYEGFSDISHGVTSGMPVGEHHIAVFPVRERRMRIPQSIIAINAENRNLIGDIVIVRQQKQLRRGRRRIAPAAGNFVIAQILRGRVYETAWTAVRKP